VIEAGAGHEPGDAEASTPPGEDRGPRTSATSCGPLNAIIGYSEMLLEDAEGGARGLRRRPAEDPSGRAARPGARQRHPGRVEDRGEDRARPGGLRRRDPPWARTPLNAVIGYCELLLEDAKGLGQEAAVPDLGKIYAAGKRFLALIEDIIHISKVEAGQSDLDLEIVAASGMIRDVVTAMRPVSAQDAGAGSETACSSSTTTGRTGPALRSLRRQGTR
jgi:signal transduction histidine kinase